MTLIRHAAKKSMTGRIETQTIHMFFWLTQTVENQLENKTLNNQSNSTYVPLEEIKKQNWRENRKNENAREIKG